MLKHEPDYAVHPGVILKDFIKTLNFKQTDLSVSTGINRSMLNEIINSKRPITVSTARKLEKDFGLPATFWLNLQANYDKRIETLKLKKTLNDDALLKDVKIDKQNQSIIKLLKTFNDLPYKSQEELIRYAEKLLSSCT